MTNQELLSKRLGALSPEKRALLQRRLVEKRADSALTLRRREETGPCPLSFGQELMWLLERLSPGISSYNVPRILRLTGPLDVGALERALNELVRRHEVLRTHFIAPHDEPAQVISPFVPRELEIIDLSGLDRESREKEAMRLAVEWSDRSFDLTRDHLLRTALLCLGEQEHVLILVSHHIVSDGWSKGILFGELRALYGAFREGKPSPLAEPAFQYADFALWQRKYFQGENYSRLLAYWKEQLAGAPPLLELPTDHPRPGVSSGKGQRMPARFPKFLADRLKELGRREGATLFMVGLAVFKVLLHRYTRQEEIVVGTPISGRSRTELEDIVGYFSNSLALRTSLAGDPTFRDLLRRVRETTLGAYSHQDMPFEKLVTELNPERTLSYTPIFQAMFSVVTAEMEQLQLPGLDVTTVFVDRGTSKFDLTLGMRDTGNELMSGVEYASDLFQAATMERLLGHYRTLLEAVVANPDTPISRLPLLTESERQELLAHGTGPRRVFPLDRCLHVQFEEQVRRTPDAVAIQAGSRSLSYRALNAQANRLAHLLRQSGVGRGDFVVVLQERGVDFLATLLGIFKSGAAYVPVDPNYPRDRIQYLLGRSEARVVVSHFAAVGRFNDLLAGCPDLRTLVCFDDRPAAALVTGRNGDLAIHDRAALAAHPDHDPENQSEPTDPLYMIFTSGSTGLPKGAIIRHDGALNHIYAQFDALGLGGDFAFLQTAPSSSDISVWQFLAPVLTGGRVVVLDEMSLLSAEKLFATIQRQRLTIIELVPAVLQLLVAHVASLPAEQRALPHLRWMMVTGEAAPVKLVNAWLGLYPAIPVANAYGPTEAADDVIQAIIRQPLPEGQRSVPIGKPLANLRVYVLDEHLQMVPVGVDGEISVAGVGVGNGYWREEAKTRASFVPDPFGGPDGGLLYRTGDLGHWIADGVIEFIGRRDNQVKVRGYRVELGEVEAVLGQSAGVQEAVVVAREDQTGHNRLFGYVTAQPGETIVAAAVCRRVNQTLPQYMALAAVCVLDALPRTPNGKVDRKALPDPGPMGAADAEEKVAPRTPVEEVLAAIWRELLELEFVGVHDNFFAIGGHSLLATQVLSRVRERLQVDLDLRDLFGAPTVAELAELVFRKMADETAGEDRNGAAVGLEAVRAQLDGQADGWDEGAW